MSECGPNTFYSVLHFACFHSAGANLTASQSVEYRDRQLQPNLAAKDHFTAWSLSAVCFAGFTTNFAVMAMVGKRWEMMASFC